MLNSVIFILFIVFFLVIPPLALFNIIHLTKRDDALVNLGISTGAGIIILTILTILFRTIRIDLRILWILPILSIFYFYRKKGRLLNGDYPQKILSLLFPTLIILFGTIAQSYPLLRGGSLNTKGIIFPAVHDTLWNVSVVAELYHHFPPEHPGFAGMALRNHHYFYHLFLATTANLTHLNIIDLYYKFGPLLVAFLFGLSLYLFTALFTKKTFFRGLGIFLGYFSGSFAFLAPIFLGRNFDWTHNIFLSDQPFDQITNPYTVLGLALFLLGLYSFYKAKIDGERFNWIFLTSLFFGTLYGFKSFGGILALLSLALSSLILYFLYRKINSFIIFIFSLSLFLPIFLSLTNFGSASLNWAPGWILTAMVADKDRLNLPNIASIESYYQSIHNYFGLFKFKSLELIIYFLGNLGIRFIGLIYIVNLIKGDFKNPNKSKEIAFLILTSSVLIFALSIPLLFNLSLNAYDVMQFTPYALIIFALFTSIALGKIYDFTARKKKQTIGGIFLLIIIFLAIPTTAKTFLASLPPPPAIVSHDEVAALNYIKENSHIDELILINPDYFKDPMYISALSERRLYLGDRGLVSHTGLNTDNRLKEVTEYFKGTRDESFLSSRHISFIYTPKQYSANFSLKNLNLFYGNKSVLVYKVRVN